MKVVAFRTTGLYIEGLWRNDVDDQKKELERKKDLCFVCFVGRWGLRVDGSRNSVLL